MNFPKVVLHTLPGILSLDKTSTTAQRWEEKKHNESILQYASGISWAHLEREKLYSTQFHIPLHHFVPYPTGQGLLPTSSVGRILVATGGPWGGGGAIVLDYNVACS